MSYAPRLWRSTATIYASENRIIIFSRAIHVRCQLQTANQRTRSFDSIKLLFVEAKSQRWPNGLGAPYYNSHIQWQRTRNTEIRSSRPIRPGFRNDA